MPETKMIKMLTTADLNTHHRMVTSHSAGAGTVTPPSKLGAKPTKPLPNFGDGQSLMRDGSSTLQLETTRSTVDAFTMSLMQAILAAHHA